MGWVANSKVTCAASARRPAFSVAFLVTSFFSQLQPNDIKFLKLVLAISICPPARIRFARISTADQYLLFLRRTSDHRVLFWSFQPSEILMVQSLHLEGTAINCDLPGGIYHSAHHPKIWDISGLHHFPHCLTAFTADDSGIESDRRINPLFEEF